MQRTRICEADKISSLPDDILRHILSLLTTKKAVHTSLLSKRWTHIWQSCHTIDFTDIQIHCIRSNHRFNKSVESVLCTADSHTINTFRLEILYGHPYGHPYFSNVVKWIDFVVQGELKNLSLHLDVDQYDNKDQHFLPILPKSIFTCKTLVSLNLRRFCVEGYSFSSNRIGYPSLETLRLYDIEFQQGQDFLLLLSGCPVLKDLILFRVYLQCWFNEPDILFKKFKSLRMPRLTSANIIKSLWDILPLEALATSKSLCLDTLKHHEVFKVNLAQGLFDDIPIFHNLTHLKLHNSWDLVIQMIHYCPKLQSIELYEAVFGARWNDQVELDIVPQCLLSHLRTCTIQYLGRLHMDLILPMYILKNARILQTMKITIWYQSEQSEIERKLSLCPEASAACQLFIHV